MAMKIVILEDNQDRVAVMRACLRDRFHQYDARFFDDARKTIEFLNESLDETILLLLDHDLELKCDSNGVTTDPGTGREVADFLAGKPAVCPVIIHTTNSAAGAGMEMALQESNWQTLRVVPYDDTTWITEEWFKTVRKAIVGMAREPARRHP